MSQARRTQHFAREARGGKCRVRLSWPIKRLLSGLLALNNRLKRPKYWFLWLQQQAPSDWLFNCNDWALLSFNERALLARFPRHIKCNLCLTHVIQKGHPLTNVT